jgi:hypothetical protein
VIVRQVNTTNHVESPIPKPDQRNSFENDYPDVNVIEHKCRSLEVDKKAAVDWGTLPRGAGSEMRTNNGRYIF